MDPPTAVSLKFALRASRDRSLGQAQLLGLLDLASREAQGRSFRLKVRPCLKENFDRPVKVRYVAEDRKGTTACARRATQQRPSGLVSVKEGVATAAVA